MQQRHVEPRPGVQQGEESWAQRFEKVEMLGHGSYAVVYAAADRDTGSFAALKVTYQEEFGRLDLGRELDMMQRLSHPGIAGLLDGRIFEEPPRVEIARELMDMELRAYIRLLHSALPQPLGRPQLQALFAQCTAPVAYCHARQVIHADVSTHNFFVDVRSGRVKLADFGLARSVTPGSAGLLNDRYALVSKLWYRAPEILLGQERYSFPVDVWSLGCVIGEIVLNQPLFPSGSEIDAIFQIFRLCGTPTHESWPGLDELSFFNPNFPQWRAGRLDELEARAPALGCAGAQMLRSALCCYPGARSSAEQLRSHGYLCDVRPEVHALACLGSSLRRAEAWRLEASRHRRAPRLGVVAEAPLAPPATAIPLLEVEGLLPQPTAARYRGAMAIIGDANAGGIATMDASLGAANSLIAAGIGCLLVQYDAGQQVAFLEFCSKLDFLLVCDTHGSEKGAASKSIRTAGLNDLECRGLLIWDAPAEVRNPAECEVAAEGLALGGLAGSPRELQEGGQRRLLLDARGWSSLLFVQAVTRELERVVVPPLSFQGVLANQLATYLNVD